MIVRTLDEVVGSDRDVAGEGWRSRRLLLRRDQLGFSLHDTTVAAGTELTLQYKHHLEACYLMAGEAELTDLATGEKHVLLGRCTHSTSTTAIRSGCGLSFIWCASSTRL